MSATRTSAVSAPAVTVTDTEVPGGVCTAALVSRLSSTCRDPLRVQQQRQRLRSRRHRQRAPRVGGAERVGRLPHQLRQIGVGPPQRRLDLGGVQPGEQQQVVQEHPHPRRLGPQPGQVPLPFPGLVGGRVLEEVGVAP
ncbi:hypothetical protein SFUMM280S_03735 [Streptomyces fumanus]